MQMLNRAIEDAAYTADFIRKLQEPARRSTAPITKEMQAKPIPPKRPGENRRDYRARVLAAQGAKA